MKPDSPRIAGSTLPVRFESEEDPGLYGALAFIDTIGLEEPVLGKAEMLNQEIREAYGRDPTIDHRKGYAFRAFRTLGLQMTGKQYRQASDVIGDKAGVLERVESGQNAETIYRQAMDEWLGVTEAWNDPVVIQLYKSNRATIAHLCQNGKADTLQTFFEEMMLRYGQRDFERHANITRNALDRRRTNNQHGHPLENYNGVKGLILLDADTTELSPEQLWDHPLMSRYRTLMLSALVDEFRSKKRPTDIQAQTALRLKLLITQGGHPLHDKAIFQAFNGIVLSREARALASGNMLPDEAKVRQMLAKLILDKAIPQKAADAFLEEMLSADAPAETVHAPSAFGASMQQSMDAANLTSADAVHALRIEGTSPQSTLDETVEYGRLNGISMHALSCLTRDDMAEVSADMEALFAECQRRPKAHGRAFSTAYKRLAQHGLDRESLSPEHRNTDIPMYAEDDKGHTMTFVLGDIDRKGNERSADAVRRWMALHRPGSIRQLGESVYAQEKVAAVSRSARIKETTITEMRDIAKVVPLPTLRAIADGASVVMSDDLLLDWHDRQSSDPGKESWPLPVRVLDGAIQAQGTSFSAVFQEKQNSMAPGTDAYTCDRAIRILNKWRQGKLPDDATCEKFLQTLAMAGDSPGGLLVVAARESASTEEALDAWSIRMANAGRMEELLAVLTFRQHLIAKKEERSIHEARERQYGPDLLLLLRDKKALRGRMGVSGYEPPEDPSFRGLSVAEILAMLPGISSAALMKWQPVLRQSKTLPPAEIKKYTDCAPEPERDERTLTIERVLRSVRSCKDWPPEIEATWDHFETVYIQRLIYLIEKQGLRDEKVMMTTILREAKLRAMKK